MISESHDFLILIFIRRILTPPPQNYLNFSRGKSFLKQILFHSLYEVRIRFGDSFS